MRKTICTALALCMLLLTACSSRRPPLPDEPVIYQQGEISPADEDAGYATVEHDGKVFVPYGILRGRGLFRDVSYAFGDCLGYIGDDSYTRIYALAGQSPEAWLIEFYEGGEMEQPVVLREIGTKGAAAPACVESLEYEIWKEN